MSLDYTLNYRGRDRCNYAFVCSAEMILNISENGMFHNYLENNGVINRMHYNYLENETNNNKICNKCLENQQNVSQMSGEG